MVWDLDRRTLLGALGTAGIAWLVLGSSRGSARSGFTVTHTPGEWRQLLGGPRFAVLRQAATEPPYSSPLNREHRRGIFDCAGCGQPLFSSAAKFESHTGWPSFFRALPKAVVTKADHSLFMERTEVLCRRCGSHLGHLFEDGPKPTGLRYCMNGLALRFRQA
jgi:peptide-methionine (R)-S-oxide reductase